jgi:hypothetical protein
MRKYLVRFEPAASEVKGKCANHLATEALIVYCVIIIKVYAWEMLLSNIHYLINTV